MKNLNLKSSVLIVASFIGMITSACNDKDEVTVASNQTDSIVDAEGNVYQTVKIGKQWWMAENLQVTKYRDGSSITKIQNDTAMWSQDTTGAYCVFSENNSAPGLLYNWYAVTNSKNIAPAGWHVPSDGEWKELEMQLGMSQTETEKINWRGSHEGEKLKIKSPLGWTTYENIWSTNESGFTALAGSCRLFSGIWGDPGLSSTGFWWTSSDHPDQMAWYRHLDYKNAGIFRSYGLKNNGYSIRCVKD